MREVFKTRRGVEVIKDPDDADYIEIRKEMKQDWPNLARLGEPPTRRTFDMQGNSYIWRSWEAVHREVEPEINRRYNTLTNQNKFFDL